MSNFLAISIALSCLRLAPWLLQAEEPAEVVLVNGKIYTVDADFGVVDTLGIAHGRVVSPVRGPDTRVIDLKGMTVLPGLIDAHAHILEYAEGLDQLDVGGHQTVASVLEVVKQRAAQAAPGVWIVGGGWDQNVWSDYQNFPTAAMLTAAAPDNPVALLRVDYHALWVNSKAMEAAGVRVDTAAPEGGEILDGVFIDNAMPLITRHIPETTPERLEVLLSRAIGDLHAVGVTGNHEMMATPALVAAVKRMINRDAFPYRLVVYYSSEGISRSELADLFRDPVRVFGQDQLTIAGIKAFTDGALGSRGAALLEPYADRPETSGLTLISYDELKSLAQLALAHRCQLATHAIGDRANRMVLDAYEEVLGAAANSDHRWRIEHAQIITPEDVCRFAPLGILPSVQPTHCTSDYSWAIDRLGAERIEWAYLWKALVDCGSVVPLGSDFPIEPINPFYGLHAAITRKPRSIAAHAGYDVEECLPADQAVRGFTCWAAYAARMEAKVGSLELGKYADFIVLDRDPMAGPPESIHTTRVLQTYLAGALVYSRDSDLLLSPSKPLLPLLAETPE